MIIKILTVIILLTKKVLNFHNYFHTCQINYSIQFDNPQNN